MSLTLLEQPTSPAPTNTSTAASWLRDLQTSAAERLALCPVPGRTDEAWRFANLRHLERLEQFHPAAASHPGAEDDEYEPSDAALAAGRLLSQLSAIHIHFVNDRIDSPLKAAQLQLPQGVTCLPLKDALASHGDLVRQHFMREANRAGSERYALLHQAHLSGGLFLHLADGVEINEPIIIDHLIDGDNLAIYPHLLVVAGRNSKVTVVEGLRSSTANDTGFALGVCDLVAGAGSHLTYLQLQQLNGSSFAMQLNSGVAHRDAHVTTGFLNLGAKWVRQVSTTRLLEAGADSRMISASVGQDSQEIDQRTLQSHEAPHTTSDLLYKNVLDDKARSIFAGLIQVQEGAHHTDAYQKCRNLLLSDSAEANSMPGLEINADQVKCSHGATAGTIDAEQLFYLASRGLHTAAAEHLIALGFAVETLDPLANESLKQALTEEIDRALLHQA